MTTKSHEMPTRLSQVENLSAYGDKTILIGYASASVDTHYSTDRTNMFVLNRKTEKK
jgi:hypothetical protein